MMAMLKPRAYYVMLALSGGARHGLAIARDVQELSEGELRLWPATLYGTIGAIFGLLAFIYVAMWLFLLAAEITQLRRAPESPITSADA